MLNLEDQIRQTKALFSLWKDWVIACGAPMVVMLFSLWVSAIWLPLVTFVLTALLIYAIKVDKQSEMASFSVSIFIMSRVMFFSGVIMLTLAFLVKHELLEQWFGAYNRVHAYIPELVIAPVTFIYGQFTLLRGDRLGFYRDFKARLGQNVEQGFLGRMFRQEGRLQQKVLTYLFLFLTVEGYLYYWLVYYNGYYNATDKLVFVWLPIILFVVSVIYMGLRYFMLWMYYGQDRQGGDMEHNGVTRLRYVIVCDDKIYLAPKSDRNYQHESGEVYDTPAVYTFQRREDIQPHEAERYFIGLTKIQDFTLRFMYDTRTVGGVSNVVHYIVEVYDAEELEKSPIKGEWYTLAEVVTFNNEHRLSKNFAAELSRLYHVTMAWKTYDRNGYRRYREKHYRPAFRMRDIHNPDIDYNDRQWLYVARMNEDMPFFRLRRWWDGVINGVEYARGKRVKKKSDKKMPRGES